ncbi:Mth938-like domain-containing protein [Methylophilus sp. 3sh_L]|uniref:Mth938-like domain-containing protein n=1 Tax=Methylophilus sp. 3sh_L TaxID=3377114 RepID=UPI00398EA186
MKLHLHTGEQQYQIHGVDHEAVIINHQRYEQAVIVSEQALSNDWFKGPWETLDAQALSVILAFKPEVVLLGTGNKQRFIHPKHTQAFLSAHIAVECMTTAAACRTFNILSAEGRKVVAALLLEKHLQSAP